MNSLPPKPNYIPTPPSLRLHHHHHSPSTTITLPPPPPISLHHDHHNHFLSTVTPNLDLLVSTPSASMNENKGCEPKWVKERRLMKQAMLILGASMAYFVMGISMSWPNVLASSLKSDPTTIFGTPIQLYDQQFDLINSIMILSNIFGFLFAGWLVNRLGRRWSLGLAAVPSLLGWTIIACALNYTMILVGRVLDGVSGGMVTVASMTYAMEISDTNYRGTMTSLVTIMFITGQASASVLGIFLRWYSVALACVVMLLLFIAFIYCFLPESPTFLVVTKQESAARTVLRYFRGDYVDLDQEIHTVWQMNKTLGEKATWKDLFHREHIKRFFILVGLFFIQSFVGVHVLRANATRLLAVFGMDTDMEVWTAVVLTVPIGGAIILSLSADVLGRRMCLVMSLVPVLVSYAVLGFFINSKMHEVQTASNLSLAYNHTALPVPGEVSLGAVDDDWWWLPMICLTVCMFFMNAGIESLPWQLSSEYFPTTIRSQAMSVSNVVGSLLITIALQLYSVMINTLTPPGLFWFYSAISTLGVIYALTCIEETAKKPVG